MNPGGGGCGEPRSHQCTPAYTTRVKICLKKKTSLEWEKRMIKEKKKRTAIVKDLFFVLVR